jgi:hypothetical protein
MAGPMMDPPVSTAEPERAGEAPGELQPRDEDVARRAYAIYQQRGGGDGQDQEDWLRAEAELRAERAARAKGGRPIRP